MFLFGVWAGYFENNDKSKRVQEKCGFIYNKAIENYECKNINECRTLHLSCLLKETANKRITIRKANEQDIDRILEIYSIMLKIQLLHLNTKLRQRRR